MDSQKDPLVCLKAPGLLTQFTNIIFVASTFFDC